MAQDPAGFVENDLQLHFQFTRLSGNHRLQSIQANLANAVRRYGEASMQQPRRMYESLDEHERFVAAVKNLDFFEARICLIEHLNNSYRSVCDFVQRDASGMMPT